MFPHSAWACVNRWVSNFLPCVRMPVHTGTYTAHTCPSCLFVLLQICLCVDCCQLPRKLPAGAFPAILLAACTGFGAWEGWGLGDKSQVWSSQKGLAFITVLWDCKLLSGLLETFPCKCHQELLILLSFSFLTPYMKLSTRKIEMNYWNEIFSLKF